MSGAAIDDLTEDALLGGRLRFLQPHRGARVSIDTMLLAAAVHAAPGETVIEAGSGSGAAALSIAVRCPGARVAGLEIEPELVALAERNARANGLDDRVRFHRGCVTVRPPALGIGYFDHALANPPYYEAATSCAPPRAHRARAYVGREARLEDWIAFCLDMVRNKGTVTLIHRADRLDALIAALYGRAGEIALCPLWPKAGLPAKRVIVHARKGMRGATMVTPGLVLHAEDGRFTPRAEALLRAGERLDLSRAAVCRLAHPERR